MPAMSLNQALGRNRRDIKDWLNRKEAANYLESIGCPITAQTLARLASNENAGGGPPFLRIRWRHVRYQPEDLRTWASKNVTRIE